MDTYDRKRRDLILAHKPIKPSEEKAVTRLFDWVLELLKLPDSDKLTDYMILNCTLNDHIEIGYLTPTKKKWDSRIMMLLANKLEDEKGFTIEYCSDVDGLESLIIKTYET